MEEIEIEPWRAVWRHLLPNLPFRGVCALAKALAEDSPEIVQGKTTEPAPYVGLYPACNGACALAFALWKGRKLDTTSDVAEAFTAIAYLAEAKGMHVDSFLCWFDNTPREEMRKQLGDELAKYLRPAFRREDSSDVFSLEVDDRS